MEEQAKYYAPVKQVDGVDVSKWQDPIDQQKLIDSGFKFCIFRLGDGNYKDPIFREEYAKAHTLNWEYGVSWYHYTRTYRTVTEQLQLIQEQLEGLPAPTLSVSPGWGFLDCEHNTSEDQRYQNTSTIHNLSKYCAQAGHHAGIYTRAEWWNQYVLGESYWATLPLWLAHWRVTVPDIPLDWELVGYSIWQYDSMVTGGQELGVGSKGLDLNRIEVETEPTPPPASELPNKLEVVVKHNGRKWKGVATLE